MAGDAVLIILDRDGVLNRTVPSATEPRPDSPLSVEQAAIFPWVPAALRRLTAAGFGIAIASNQPAAAKGKTSRAVLAEVHRVICTAAQREGGIILGSHICFHRAEDGCACRKPRTGLLAEAFASYPQYQPGASWMVGDRASDMQAGAAFGMKTAYLGDTASSDFASLTATEVRPSFCGTDLRDFVDFLLGKSPVIHG
ncbi:MAG TPA: HAD-IIIA family hydrolase [Polyangia bacterium]|jgi:D-glycero-D-manno-heptose 1,7-bisphosphate phosphatase|nr:HAD-IIIA family hydrolase [Polyangia bacterium]